MKTSVCLYCGKPFESYHDQKFCSRQCAEKSGIYKNRFPRLKIRNKTERERDNTVKLIFLMEQIKEEKRSRRLKAEVLLPRLLQQGGTNGRERQD